VASLGQGSVNGVDLDRYRPGRTAERAAVRAKYGIPADAVVVGFVARLRGEKGMIELVDAYTALKDRFPQLYLLIVGDYDIEDRPPERIVAELARDPRIKCPGWQDDPNPFFAAMDIYCMPTYRDGFGVVFIEAAASGVPSIGSDIIGARDAIEPKVSGYRVPPRDTGAVRDALAKLLDNPDLRQRLGESARGWAESHFDRHNTWALYEREYQTLLAAPLSPPESLRSG
jgi:glycosyltransferase involved in cell wall biosynthesis